MKKIIGISVALVLAVIAILTSLGWGKRSLADYQYSELHKACHIRGYDLGYAQAQQAELVVTSDTDILILEIKPLELHGISPEAVNSFQKGYQQGAIDYRLGEPNQYDESPGSEEMERFINEVRELNK